MSESRIKVVLLSREVMGVLTTQIQGRDEVCMEDLVSRRELR